MILLIGCYQQVLFGLDGLYGGYEKDLLEMKKIRIKAIMQAKMGTNDVHLLIDSDSAQKTR